MEILKMKAYAKINLTLDITGKREDGYHIIKTVMQQISIYDTVTVEKRERDIILSSGSLDLPNDSGNLAYQAAESFFKVTGVHGGVAISIKKRIPIEAGLAGGSTDAAAVLILLNQLYNAGLSTKQLCEIGEKLGADVPFCIVGGVADCRGIGELITPMKSVEPINIVLVKPAFSLSTGKIYALCDTLRLMHPQHEEFLRMWGKGTLRDISLLTGNIMEQASLHVRPEIGEIFESLNKTGALVSRMSGSGPTVYGIFEKYEDAYSAAEILKKKYPDTFLAKTI